MDVQEELRLARLLASVEKEEEFAEINRPTGTFQRQLFIEDTAGDEVTTSNYP